MELSRFGSVTVRTNEKRLFRIGESSLAESASRPPMLCHPLLVLTALLSYVGICDANAVD